MAAIERTNRDANSLLNDREVVERIGTIGPIADGSLSVEAVRAFLKSEIGRCIAITKEIGVLPE